MRRKFMERDRNSGIHMLQVRITDDLYARVEQAAKDEGFPHVSRWVRAVLIDGVLDAEELRAKTSTSPPNA